MWITFSVISGGIYWEEFKKASISQIFYLCLGLILVFYGVFHLTSDDKSTSSISANFYKQNDTNSVEISHLNDDDTSNENRPLLANKQVRNLQNLPGLYHRSIF